MKQDKADGVLSLVLRAYVRAIGFTFLFSSAFCVFFYAAQVLFVDGYSFEPGYFMANAVFMGGLALAFALLPGPVWLYTIPAYLFFLFPSVLVSVYICLYGSTFNFNTFYFVWGTTGSEAGEFLRESLRRFPLLPLWVSGCLFLPLWAAVPFVRGVRGVKARGVIVRLGLFLVAIQCVVWAGYLKEARKYNYVTQCYWSVLDFRRNSFWARTMSDSAKNLAGSLDIRPALPQGVRETYVVVVGESANRHHWHAYGYPRETTPFASARAASGDVLLFRNVCSTSFSTTTSLFRTLTFLDQLKNSMGMYTYSFIDLFNRAGFATWWLSNNAVLGVYDTMLEAFTKNATHWRVTTPKDADVQGMQRGWLFGDRALINHGEVTYDEYLLPWLDEALADPVPKKMIVLHLKGSHIIYRYRYPDSFDVFLNSKDILSPFVDDDPMIPKLINAYDNSILYTDWILEQVIRRLERHGGRSWMLHFSDHGEDVFDLNDFNGRNYEKANKFMLDVPFTVWLSEEFREGRNISLFQRYLDRPFRLDDTIHAILDLSELRTDLLDPTRSIFSEGYRMRPRVALERLYLDFPPLGLVNDATVEQEKKLNKALLSGDETL